MGEKRTTPTPSKNKQPPTKLRKPNPVDTTSSPSLFDFYFVNVGQGECTFVRLSNGKWMMIDFGSSGDWSHRFTDVIDFIYSCIPSRRLEYVILTHADRDHYNKLSNLIINKPNQKKRELFSINHLYFSAGGEGKNPLKQFTNEKVGQTIFTKKIADYIHFVNINGDKNSTTQQPNNFILTYSKNDGYKVATEERNISETGYLIASDGDSSKGTPPNWEIFIMLGNVRYLNGPKNPSITKNTVSIVTLFKVNRNEKYALLRGDATDFTDNYLLERYSTFFNQNRDNIQLGNIAHHGSKIHCNKADNISRFAPKEVIVSCQQEHIGYSHPSLNVEQDYAKHQSLNDRNIIEGFFIDNTSSNGVPNWKTIKDQWDAQGVKYVDIEMSQRKRNVVGFHIPPPYNLSSDVPFMNVAVYKNGRVYQIAWSNGNVKATFSKEGTAPSGQSRVEYVKKSL